jgi:hypothetical protein
MHVGIRAGAAAAVQGMGMFAMCNGDVCIGHLLIAMCYQEGQVAWML